ncbi:MAG: helix-turn-helix domain-containing protein [Actinomycetaceae bacterium]|nr:helix-turn-helix domain-containing protein [Actinomycetaceae bacterium]
MTSGKNFSEKGHGSASSSPKPRRKRRKTSNKVTRASRVDIDETVGTIRDLFERFLSETSDLTQNKKLTERYEITDAQRGFIFLRELHERLKQIEDWERVLIELLHKAKISQTKIAKEIDVSPNTINRWIKDPITVDLNEEDIEIERQRGHIP